jgi:hypothetical protein
MISKEFFKYSFAIVMSLVLELPTVSAQEQDTLRHRAGFGFGFDYRANVIDKLDIKYLFSDQLADTIRLSITSNSKQRSDSPEQFSSDLYTFLADGEWAYLSIWRALSIGFAEEGHEKNVHDDLYVDHDSQSLSTGCARQDILAKILHAGLGL